MSKRSSTILITSATALVVLAVSVLSGTEVRRWVAENVFDQYVAQEAVIADQVAGNLEHEMADMKDKLELTALIPAIQAADSACNARLGDVFGVLESRLGNLGRINAQGVFACSLNKALIGVPGKQLGSYVSEIFADPKHEPVLSHVILPPGATYAVAMHVPVWNAKKQFDGTLGGALYLKDLKEKFLQNVKFARHGFAVLFDENGDILFHPKTELIGKNLDSSEAKKAFSNIGGLQQAVADAKAGKRGTVRYKLEGAEKVAAYRPAMVAPDRHWVVLATVPVADASLLLSEIGVDQAFWIATGITATAIMLVAFAVMMGTLRSIRLEEILQREKAELALEKAKAQTLLSSIGDGVVAIDRQWRIVLFNGAAEHITGWSESEALGKPMREVMRLIKERTRKEDIGFIEETMLYGKVHHMAADTLLIRKDGLEVPVGDSAAPVFGPEKSVDGAIIVFRDMTEEREAARMRSDFAYASHQFRTPIAQALSALSLAEDEKNQKALKEDLKMARIGMESVHRLSVKLLAMSELEGGRVSLNMSNVDVTTLMEEVRQKILKEAGELKPEIQIQASKGLPKVHSDVAVLGDVITELLNNAIYYGAGSVRVNMAKNGRNLVLEVRNQGLPISEEDQGQIFNKFFRGSNRPAEVSGGGLGLFLVHEYVRLLGGKVWFESNKEETVFHVALPIA